MHPHLPALLAALVVAAPAGANDLLQLYHVAKTGDARLQAARFQRDALIEARPQALARWLPQLDANASAARERQGYQFAQPQNPQTSGCELSAHGTMQRCSGSNRGYGVTLSQTLWSFEAYNRLKEADLQAASAEASLLAAEQGLLLRISQAYFGILSARDQLATNRAARETFGNLLNQAKARQQTGVGPRSDVEQAQSFYDATEQGVIDAQSAIEDAELLMTEIAGARADEIAPLREDIPLAAPDPVAVEAWVASARQDNLEVRSAELQLEAVAREIAVQRGKGLPTLSLSAAGTRLRQDQTIGGNQTFDTVGISFSWPLFQGGAVASGVRQARALYGQAAAQYDSAQRDTERQTRSAYRGVVSGIQRIAAARRAVESGRDAVEASRRNVEFGTGNEFNLLSAQNNFYAAQRAYNQARYDYLTSELTLKRQAGRLAEQDLAAIDALLVPHGT